MGKIQYQAGGAGDLFKETEDLLKLRNYSSRTIKSCLFYIKEYLRFSRQEKINEKNEAIKCFLLNKQNYGNSPQTINLALNAVKFFYREVLKSPEKIDLKFAKRSKKLPIVLSRADIEKVISKIPNNKHRLIIALAYGAGLRISEVVNTRVKDIDIAELTIHVKEAKGKKDRITVFPEKIAADIKNLIAGKKENDFVFESNRGGKLTTSSLQKIFYKALKKAGIKKTPLFILCGIVSPRTCWKTALM